ncbi:MAG TPA: glycoside hydrolase family 88 protein, partial [Mariniflexile sp.]
MNLRMLLFSSVVPAALLFVSCGSAIREKTMNQPKKEVISIIHKVNTHWQENHPDHGNAFWNVAAYHTGNMEAYKVTKNKDYLNYSLAWAAKNEWMGAKSQNKSEWKYDYGETDKHVLFGDWQICFQT